MLIEYRRDRFVLENGEVGEQSEASMMAIMVNHPALVFQLPIHGRDVSEHWCRGCDEGEGIDWRIANEFPIVHSYRVNDKIDVFRGDHECPDSEYWFETIFNKMGLP